MLTKTRPSVATPLYVAMLVRPLTRVELRPEDKAEARL